MDAACEQTDAYPPVNMNPTQFRPWPAKSGEPTRAAQPHHTHLIPAQRAGKPN